MKNINWSWKNNGPNKIIKLSLASVVIAMSSISNAARPPQYVVVSFDGSKSMPMWEKTRQVAKDVGANFVYFLSGVYFLSPENKNLYNPPGRKPGKSDIGFGKSSSDISDRIDQMTAAMNEGAEMGSHVNGHFDGGKWSYAEWASEFKQFHDFILGVFTNNPKIQKPSIESQWESTLSHHLKGFRAPLLAINSNSDQVLQDFGYLYDASRVAQPNKWPYRIGGVWQFPLASIKVAGTAKKTISMDYNFYYQDSKGKDDLANASFYEDRYYQSLVNHFLNNYYGNRAPINVGNHFSNWNGGAYFRGLLRFATLVCGDKEKFPEVQCLNYQSLVQKLDAANDKQISDWEKGKFVKAERSPEVLSGPFSSSPLRAGREFEFDMDLILSSEGVLKADLSGFHKDLLVHTPKAEWVTSYWSSSYSVDDITHLALPESGAKVVEKRNEGTEPQLETNFPMDGNYVYRLALVVNGREIQSVAKKIQVQDKKIVAIASISEESLATKGDRTEAHQEEDTSAPVAE